MRDAGLILRFCAMRHWRLAWRQQLLLLLILALGTAVHVAMRLANRAAMEGFSQFTETLTRDADWTLRAPAGPISESWLREMRSALDPLPVTLLPVMEATVVPFSTVDEASIGSRPTWRLVGMDLVGLQNLRSVVSLPTDLSQTQVGDVFVGVGMAQKQNWKPGDLIQVVINDEVAELRLGALIPTLPNLPAPPDHLLLMDLPAVQQRLQRPGEVDRVEVLAPSGAAFPTLRAEAKVQLERVAQGRWQVMGGDDRRALADGMTAAFRLNLTILSLLALLVGGYLMFQALDGVVIRRREEIAILRSLGVKASSIRHAFLLEALLIGLVAGVVGVLVGWLGAQGAVRGVAATMTALYGASSATAAALPAVEWIIGICMSIGTSLIAAWLPANTAAALPPAQALGHHAVVWQGRSPWRAEWVGGIFLLAAIIFSQLPAWRTESMRVPLGAYVAAFAWLLGASLVASALLRLFRPGSQPVQTIAASHLRRPSLRHRFAVAALTSAVAMTTGMAIMIASFDHTMKGWIRRSMSADIYLSSAGAQSASSTHQIRASTVAEIASMSEVKEAASVHFTLIQLPDGPASVLGSDMDFAARHDLHAWLTAPPKDWWQTGDDLVLINESLSTRLGCAVGSQLSLPTAVGPRQIKVAGIYADYGNERGSVLIPAERFERWFGHRDAWRVALMLQEGVDAETFRNRLQERFPAISVFTQDHLRSEALRIFRQTFAVTYALEAVGVVVAVAGLGLALAGLMLDRRPDLSTLRAMGFSARDLARACALEGLGLGLAGVIAGAASGLWLGWLLIARVNKQAFGWTLSFSFPWLQVLLLMAAVLIVGTAVAAMVGRWSSTLKSEQQA
jgi:putative ABC transport system permease protein